LAFRDSAALMIVVLCIEISLFSALISWRGTPMSERVAEVTILLCEVAAENYLVIQRIGDANMK